MEEPNTAKPERGVAVLVAALLLAGAHQYLFYGKMPGVSIPIFVGLLYVFMMYYAKDALREMNVAGYAGLGVIVLLAMTFALFANPVFRALNMLVLPVLILVHMTYMLSYRRPEWSGLKLIGAAAEHLFPQTLHQIGASFSQIRRKGGDAVRDERKQVMVKVLIGLGISAPLLIIVVSLLSSADGVFSETLNRVPQLLERISFGEGAARTLWVLLLGGGLFGLVLGFAQPKTFDWNTGLPEMENKQAYEPVSFGFDPVVMITVLASVNMVYLLFVSVQFSYLFGAWDGLLPEGSTYADYARSGFLELVLVTGINFIILLLSLSALSKARSLLHKATSILLYILVLCSLVMLYSAFSRLLLYEEAYGYTYIRFLVHAFMIMLGLAMLLTAVRISKTDFPLAKCYIVLGLSSYVLMNYIGMDNIIAAQNIKRYEDSGVVDADYLTRLSWDAVPRLAEFSRSEGGILEQGLREKWDGEAQRHQPWASYNLARQQGRQALEQDFNP
ncbi:DUF4153 domain-containing protein ['Paenibacillus yunnanensis' Narsing Rao et al. 2020]|uniref:DUF4153 domain-containing protein n=1 Tax=Paenibacillus tengchongensis TaxID=2608684 RepID=UPI00124DC643|nr:DUF4173 domain-containing protein [Paenibacillus tengchongensis]